MTAQDSLKTQLVWLTECMTKHCFAVHCSVLVHFSTLTDRMSVCFHEQDKLEAVYTATQTHTMAVWCLRGRGRDRRALRGPVCLEGVSPLLPCHPTHPGPMFLPTRECWQRVSSSGPSTQPQIEAPGVGRRERDIIKLSMIIIILS